MFLITSFIEAYERDLSLGCLRLNGKFERKSWPRSLEFDLEGYDGIKFELMDALKQAKLEHRTKEKDLAKSETHLEETSDKMATLRRNLHEKKKELTSMTEEIAKYKSTISSEENALDEKLYKY